MAGKIRVSDERVIAVWNDIERYPKTKDVADELGYQERWLRQGVLPRIRKEHGPNVLVDRAANYHRRGRKQVEPGRFLVAVKPKVERWFITAAQDETPVHRPFWRNVKAYCDAIGAELLVGGFTYNKSLFEDHASRTAVFAEQVRPYLRHENCDLGPLMFAAKMNILPTAVRPLSGLDTYSQGRWAVIPHAKVQLVSVPSLPGRHPAMVMTTGACTEPNYIEKKAGLKAEFHHVIGGTIVELDEAGNLFCRQISATDDGNFQDLDMVVRDGKVSRGNRVEQITWGDIHMEKMDPVVALHGWGYDIVKERVVSTDTMIHALKPRHQAFHDLLDFQARNHHRRNDHHFLFEMLVSGSDKVEDGVAACARFLRATAFDWVTSVVVASNHNDALVRWLREADPRDDVRNFRYWCELNAEYYRRIEEGDMEFDIIAWAMQQHDPEARMLDDIVFVPRNGSYVVCQRHGGIETGLHGDEGPNGARGTALNMNRIAVRINRGHEHTASIVDGVFTSGLSGLLDQGYNSGPSGWSQTHTVTYPNAKRTLVTMIDGKWRG